MVMDGNRRWARQIGFPDGKVGHRYGAEHQGRRRPPLPGVEVTPAANRKGSLIAAR